jgi:hypothetical protein
VVAVSAIAERRERKPGQQREEDGANDADGEERTE